MKIYKDLVNTKKLFLIAGPCVVENEITTFKIAEAIIKISEKHKINFIFKASFKKANRSKIDSFVGIGDKKAIKILKKIKDSYKIPVITDVHSKEDVHLVSENVDFLQIPAFLCRQTDLLTEAGKSKLPVNIKKGQFVSPQSMKFAAEKIIATGNNKILITERGTFFGYNDLVVDYRNIPIMQKFGYPVVLDCTHSLQQPNQNSGITGGNPEFIETIAKAGVAVGVNGIFLETHPEPSKALSDGSNMLILNKLETLIVKLIKINNVFNK